MTQNQFLPEQILIPFFGKEKPISGVEIGVLGASGSVAMLNRMPNLFLYCIDPWKHFDRGFEAERNQEWHDETYAGAVHRLEEFKDRTKILRMTSDEAAKKLNGKFDFVWIDGDHSEDQVKKDMLNWKDKIKRPGIIGGHDYQIDYIARLAKETFKEIKTGEDFTWWHIYE